MAQPNGSSVGVSSWALAIVGIAAIVFGVLTVLWPHITLLVIVILFGTLALATGIVSIFEMFTAMREHRTWWIHLLMGALSIIAGLYALANPGVTAVVLLYVVAFWAIALGVFEIIGSFVTGQFMMFVVGLLGIVIGFVLLANPGAGVLAYVVVIGVFAIVRGILLLVQAIRQPSLPAAS
jgi:uncharacterized membrane protein HdeD (DUF308 family)